MLRKNNKESRKIVELRKKFCTKLIKANDRIMSDYWSYTIVAWQMLVDMSEENMHT